MKLLLSVVLLAAFLLCPASCADGVRDGLQLAAYQALPALFPFFVAGGLLVRSGAAELLARLATKPLARLYHLPPAAASAVMLGMLGGYPVGASTAASLMEQGLLGAEDAARVVSFCNCASPGFCVALCGLTVCGSARTGAVLYIIHILSALLTGLVTARGRMSAPDARPTPSAAAGSFASAFCGAVQDAAKTSLTVTAFLTVFSVLLSLLAPVLSDLPCTAVFTGLTELTNGLGLLAQTPYSLQTMLPLLSLLLGFGGLAVHFQVRAVLSPYGLSLRRFTIGKLLHGLIAAALTVLFCRLSPAPLSVFSPVAAPHVSNSTYAAVLSAVLILLSFWGGKQTKNKL